MGKKLGRLKGFVLAVFANLSITIRSDHRSSATRFLRCYLFAHTFFCPLPVPSYPDAKHARARR
jgi:hypothetical protein